jgi:pSer/pThr/pTyr-binding forkhead associated (FHA) protein
MISFFPEGNTSVSGKHCTLQLYYGKFYIIDDHSLNGTTVNGKAVEPGKPHPLSEGDEIVLGDPAIRGVHLRLSITEAAKGHAGVDATQYGKADQDSVDDQPPDSDAG